MISLALEHLLTDNDRARLSLRSQQAQVTVARLALLCYVRQEGRGSHHRSCEQGLAQPRWTRTRSSFSKFHISRKSRRLLGVGAHGGRQEVSSTTLCFQSSEGLWVGQRTSVRSPQPVAVPSQAQERVITSPGLSQRISVELLHLHSPTSFPFQTFS